MDIINLAIRQVEREGKLAQENWMELVLDRALSIRRWMDVSDKNLKAAETRRKRNETN